MNDKKENKEEKPKRVYRNDSEDWAIPMDEVVKKVKVSNYKKKNKKKD